MFKSFFPNPKWFFLSLVLWSTACITVWYLHQETLGSILGLDLAPSDPIIGLGHFITPKFLLFYCYYTLCAGFFAVFWFLISPHKWQMWSVIGSAGILFSTYYSVQVSVALNNWRRPTFDAIQNAHQPPNVGPRCGEPNTGKCHFMVPLWFRSFRDLPPLAHRRAMGRPGDAWQPAALVPRRGCTCCDADKV